MSTSHRHFFRFHVPSSGDPPKGAIVNAFEFMRSQISERGVLGEFDPEILEYPNYSTAFALMCLKQVGDEKDAALIGRMEDYLVSEQF